MLQTNIPAALSLTFHEEDDMRFFEWFNAILKQKLIIEEDMASLQSGTVSIKRKTLPRRGIIQNLLRENGDETDPDNVEVENPLAGGSSSGEDYDVIHLVNLYMSSRCFLFGGALRNHLLSLVLNHLHYRLPFFDLATRAKKFLHHYSAVHVKAFRNSQERRGNLTETHIEPMREFIENGTNIFVATDDSHADQVKKFFEEQFPGNRIFMWPDLVHLFSDHRLILDDPDVVGILQQLVCVYADEKFYPSRESPYSVYITKLRQTLRTGKTIFGGIVNLEVPKALWF